MNSPLAYKRILVPLDGSRLAEQVLPYVRLLANGFKSPVQLLHVIEPQPLAVARLPDIAHRDPTTARMLSQAQAYLGKVAASLSKEEELGVSFVVREGSASSCIVRESEQEPDTLVAMSTRGRSGIARWVLGSVTNEVLHTATGPLLITRSQEEESFNPELQLKMAIVPLDGSPLAEQVLPHVESLAQVLELSVALLRATPCIGDGSYLEYLVGPHEGFSQDVDERAVRYLREVGQRLRRQGVVTVEERLVHCDPAVATVAFDRESQQDLIVMATHGRPVLGGFLQARVTDLVARHSRHPILVIPVMEENPRGGLYQTESDGG